MLVNSGREHPFNLYIKRFDASVFLRCPQIFAYFYQKPQKASDTRSQSDIFHNIRLFSAYGIASLLVTAVLARPAPTPNGILRKRSFRLAAVYHEAAPNPDIGNQTARFDGGWHFTIRVGEQQMIQNIDTGSADLWVASTLMSQTDQAKVGPPVFDPTKSTAYKPIKGYTFGIGYGDGSSSSGIVAHEQINIGGATSRNTDEQVGLAFKYGNSIRPVQKRTFMEFLQPHVDQPIFTTVLTQNDSGYVIFGTTDDSAYTGNLTHVAADNSTGA
ncbi:hypothetical protein MMC13_004164 [Lambiella insularis]|nr:hypothetical protein [Lambiella insularis]